MNFAVQCSYNPVIGNKDLPLGKEIICFRLRWEFIVNMLENKLINCSITKLQLN